MTEGSMTTSSSEGSTTSGTACETDCLLEEWETTCMAFAAKLQSCEPGTDPLYEEAACMGEIEEGASTGSECSVAILAWYNCQAEAGCDEMEPVCIEESTQLMSSCPDLL